MENQPIIQFSIGKQNFATTVFNKNPDKKTLITRIHAYLGLVAINALKSLTNLDMVDYKAHSSWHPEWIYISLVSKQSANHPWVAVCNIYHTTFEIYRPFGRDYGQISIEKFANILSNNRFAKHQYYGFYILFMENMRVRKEEMIYSPRFSLLKCDNIKQCLAKKKKIMKSRKSPAIKQAELNTIQSYYEKKSIAFILKYFAILDARDYDEAYAFLKMKRGKYFGKQRLDTFYVNTGDIIGHLQIFIEIYKLIYHVIDIFKSIP